jgi:ubiquinone/menaquinone biosynthesis C-methylase UbiE
VNPYLFLEDIVDKGTSVLSLCCGVGIELASLETKSITAVDIAPQYIKELKKILPFVKGVVSDALEYTKKAKDNSFDVISLFDAIEHLTKEDGQELLKECKRVASKHVLVFTPEGYVRNEPHNAWGIEGADHWQQHLSGWDMKELRELGFTILHRQPSKTQHGEDYHSLMARWDRV